MRQTEKKLPSIVEIERLVEQQMEALEGPTPPVEAFSEILRLVWDQSQAMRRPLASVEAVERRAKRIDELVRRNARKRLFQPAS